MLIILVFKHKSGIVSMLNGFLRRWFFVFFIKYPVTRTGTLFMYLRYHVPNWLELLLTAKDILAHFILPTVLTAAALTLYYGTGLFHPCPLAAMGFKLGTEQ